MSLANLALSGYQPPSWGDECPQCGALEYLSTKEMESCGELIACECGAKACKFCLAEHHGMCTKCFLEEQDAELPDEAYDADDFRDLGGLGSEPR